MKLPEGYIARTPTLADAQEAADVIAACQARETGKPEMSVEELRSDWQAIDLDEDATTIVGPDGRIVAVGDVFNRRYVRVSFYGYVHPQHERRGLGMYLVRWAEEWIRKRLERSPAGVQVVLEFYANGANGSARHLLEGSGYPRVRTIYVMEIDLDRVPSRMAWPTGIDVRTYVPGRDDQALFVAGEAAFRDSWSRPPGTMQTWTRETRADNFDPELWFLPVDTATGHAAGICLATAVVGRGWINSLGVHPAYRKKGLGLALLLHAFGAFYRRGITNIGLSVDADSPTGAPRLYTRAGMKVVQTFDVYRREIRPGTDFTQWRGEEEP